MYSHYFYPTEVAKNKTEKQYPFKEAISAYTEASKASQLDSDMSLDGFFKQPSQHYHYSQLLNNQQQQFYQQQQQQQKQSTQELQQQKKQESTSKKRGNLENNKEFPFNIEQKKEVGTVQTKKKQEQDEKTTK